MGGYEWRALFGRWSAPSEEGLPGGVVTERKRVATGACEQPDRRQPLQRRHERISATRRAREALTRSAPRTGQVLPRESTSTGVLGVGF